MSVLSGIGGVVDGVEAMRTWMVAHSADLQAFVASNTQEGTVVIPGNEDWSGNYNAYGHTPLKMPGEGFTFTGTIDGVNGATGTAIVDSVEVTIDIEAGAVIAHVVNFSGNGALTLGAAAATDSSDPCQPSSIGCKVEIGTMVAVPVYTEISDVRTITLTLTRENQAYVSSGTSGGVRRTEGNLSGTVAISVYEDDFADLPAVNSANYLRIYVNATEYWDIAFVRWGEASDLEVDREGATLLGATLNAQWSASGSVDGLCTVGHIKEPDTTQYWPV